MLRILEIEWLKIKVYSAFWWVVGIIVVAYPAVTYASLEFYKRILEDPRLPGQAIKASIENPFAFGEVWHTVAYLSSFFIFFPALVVIMLITNEYTFKTHRQNIIDGWTRNQFMTGKFFDVAVLSVLVTLVYFLVCVIVGLSNDQGDVVGNKIYFLAYFLLQTFSHLTIAFFIGFILRKAIIALGVFIFLFFILEPILVNVLSAWKVQLGSFLPFEISDRMIPPPALFGKMDPAAYEVEMGKTGNHFFYTLIFTTLIWLLCYRLNTKRDF